MIAERRRTRPRWRMRNTRRRIGTQLLRTDVRRGGVRTSTVTPGEGAGPGVDGDRSQARLEGLIRTTLADWVMYRQPWESTVARSPRLPPEKMLSWVIGLVVRSARVTVPSLRLTTTKAGPPPGGATPAATPSPART